MTRGPVDPRLLRHARTARGGVAALALLGAGQAAATLAVAAALTLLVVALADNRTGTGTALALLAGAFAARAALTWAEQVVARRTAARVTDELRRAVLAAALRRGPAWAAEFGTGRLSAVLGGGLDALGPWFSGYLPTLVLGVVLPPLVVVVMAVVDPASALITLVTLPLVPVFGALIGWATQRRAQQRWAADARLAGHFLDVVRGLATLRLYGRARRQVAVVEAMTDRHRIATVRVLRVAFLSSTALDLVGTLSVGLVAVEVGLRVAAGDLGLGPALLVILLAPEAYRPLRETAARYHASADAAAVIADVDEVLSGSAAPLPERREQATPGIVATGLRVRHPGSTVDALDLPSLTVRGGEIVALRGASGAGKTTALRALAGLQARQAGELRVSGPRLLYLPQRPTLPHARTVAEAVALDGETRPADAVVAEALRAVGLADELADPGKPLGEHGGGVSSGQRQRLALARLLREAQSRPVVLLLDEPTAHLDSTAEQVVIGRLRAAAERGCAVLVVAHRPALLAAADRIVDLTTPAEPGRVPRTPAPPPVTALPTAARRATAGLSPATPPPVSVTARTTPGNTAPPTAASGSTAARSGVLPVDVASRGAPRRGAGLAGRSGTVAALGAASWLAGVTLAGAATWLLVRASTLPPVLTLSTAVVLVRASAVARPLLRYLERLAAHETAFVRLGAWRSGVYADLIPRVPGRTVHRRGELLTRVVDDVDARVDGVLRGRLPAASAATAAAVVVTATLVLHPAVGVVLLAGLAVSGWLAPALAARHVSRVDAATGRARAELRDAVVETVDGLEELASRDPAAALAVPVRRSRALARYEARAAWSAGGAAALAQLGWGLAVTAVAVAVPESVPELAAVLLLTAVALAEPVLALSDAAVARRRAAGARDRLAAIAAQPPSVAPRPEQQAAGQPGADQPGAGQPGAGRAGSGEPLGGLAVRGLVAGWDPQRTPPLHGLDLELPAGARVAVLGPSGSGKSTLAAVLVRLLDPVAGSVTLGGVDVRTMPARDVRRRVGLVSDDVDHVFASTVRENLRLARPEATDAELLDVLTRVRLGDWLPGLPAGLDTWLGEGASTISGGQQRRLATARALLADPEILVLDEPTEGLDEATAAALMADLLDAASGRSVLVLTHRLDGLDRVDAVQDVVDGRLRPSALPRSGGAATKRRPRSLDVCGTARTAS